MKRELQKWLSVAVFNLLIVAFLGCLLRYKIGYSLPIINQQFLLHAHSHFAFAGWVTQALMVLMVKYLGDKSQQNQFPAYRWILWANLLTAYGMLFTFPFEGYALWSIIFSTASVFSNYAFAFKYWKDLNKISPKTITNSFFKASLFFNVLSSIGPFSLAYMMATKSIHSDLYLASVYFFLHFQYNGWFIFACLGLFSYRLLLTGIPESKLKTAFYLFAGACFPAYFLSALWIPMPVWIYMLVIVAVIAQLAGWIIILNQIILHKALLRSHFNSFTRILLILVAIAFSIKLCLQAASSIPSLSFLTFGFRPIVIGYLHLVLLGVVSLFIISYCIPYVYPALNKENKNGMIIFVAGIIFNELLLMAEGIADLKYQTIPYMNEALLGAAVILFIGGLLMNISIRRVEI